MSVDQPEHAHLEIFGVPDELELMAVYRLGYLPAEQRRPAIDCSPATATTPTTE